MFAYNGVQREEMDTVTNIHTLRDQPLELRSLDPWSALRGPFIY